MSQLKDKNQLYLDIEIGEAIEERRINRRKRLKKTIFDRNQLSFDDLDRITFEITYKDFEFFYAYILEREGYRDVEVSKDDMDMIDIRAKKDGKIYLIQCKQWMDKNISVQQVAEMYSKMYHEYYEKRENTIMQIVTTSYFDKFAREFLEGNKIEGINNIKLIEMCEKGSYFSQERWKDLKIDIYKKRLDRLKGTMNERKQSLWQLRYHELLKHTKNGGQGIHFRTRSQKSIEFLQNHFFQHFDLV